jgi:hypothetical protein
MLNVFSIIWYGLTTPHGVGFGKRWGLELVNECFIMIGAYHLIVYSNAYPYDA